MPPRTLFLGKLIGLFCLLFALTTLLHKQATVDAVSDVLNSPGLMLVLGVATLIAGLAMVLAHNVWSGGALPAIVTFIGWLTLAKGLMILVLPTGAEADLYLRVLHYQRLFYLDAAVFLALGAYLTFSSFHAASRS